MARIVWIIFLKCINAKLEGDNYFGDYVNNSYDTLGNCLTTKEISEKLKVDQKTVRKYYLELGGIRIGRHFRFFEKEVLNAIQTWNEVYRTVEEERSEKGKGFQGQKGGAGLGGGDAAEVRRRLERSDKHNLFG